MGDDEKLVDKWSYKSTKNLHNIIKDWHADTDEAAKKRKAAEEEVSAHRMQYKKSAYGILGEKYKFDNDKRYEQSEHLINKLVVDAAKKRDGDEAASALKKNPEMIRAYAKEVLGVNYEQVHAQMAEAEGDQLEQLLDQLSGDLAQSSAKGMKDVNKATQELIRNPKHYEENKKLASDVLGGKIKQDTPMQYVVNHIKQGYQGNINSDYKARYKGKHYE